MARLLYDVERRLRDGERVLADFLGEGPYGCIHVGGAQYEIEHEGRLGWRFELVDAGGERVCEYHPSPVVRGGRLQGRWTAVSLRGVPLRPRRWIFSGDPSWRLQAKVTSAAPTYEVALDGDVPMSSPELTMQLAFGCWILVERQSLPGGGGGGG